MQWNGLRLQSTSGSSLPGQFQSRFCHHLQIFHHTLILKLLNLANPVLLLPTLLPPLPNQCRFKQTTILLRPVPTFSGWPDDAHIRLRVLQYTHLTLVEAGGENVSCS